MVLVCFDICPHSFFAIRWVRVRVRVKVRVRVRVRDSTLGLGLRVSVRVRDSTLRLGLRLWADLPRRRSCKSYPLYTFFIKGSFCTETRLVCILAV